MPKKLDYSAAWNDAMALLRTHREGVIAISGFFLFATGWAGSYLMPQPDLTGLQTIGAMMSALREYFAQVWFYLIPLAFLTAYGAFAIYVLISGPSLSTIGDALALALSRFLPFFIASLVLGWLTMLGILAFIIPGLYLAARFSLLPAAMASKPQLGILDGIKECWAVSKGAGWKILLLLFVITLLTWLVVTVVGLVVGVVCAIVAGPEGIPLVEFFFEALLSTIGNVILIAVIAAIYRQLEPQSAQ